MPFLDRAVCIDLGTTNSEISFSPRTHGKVDIVESTPPPPSVFAKAASSILSFGGHGGITIVQ